MSAKEMFKKLGYKEDRDENGVTYYKPVNRNQEIQIQIRYKEIRKLNADTLYAEGITLAEFKAIKKEVKELGW